MTLPDKQTVEQLQAAKDLLQKHGVLSNTEDARIQSKLDKLAGENWTKYQAWNRKK